MKKLGEMYNETQKEQQIQLQQAQVFNISTSFFSSSSQPNQNLNTSFPYNSNPLQSISSQPENKMTISISL